MSGFRLAVAIVLISGLAAWSQGVVQAADAAKISKGAMVSSSEGARLGAVYRVTEDGSAQVILDGKMITIPASTLSTQNGGVTTSLKKSEVLALKR